MAVTGSQPSWMWAVSTGSTSSPRRTRTTYSGALSRAAYTGRVRDGRVSGTLVNDGAGRPLKWEARRTGKAPVPSFSAVEAQPVQGMDAR